MVHEGAPQAIELREEGPVEALLDVDLGIGKIDRSTPEWERLESYLELLESCVRDESMYLDKGGAGKVFAVRNSGYCVKVLKDRPPETPEGIKYNLGNAARDEVYYQQKVQHLQVKGARAPICLKVFYEGGHAAIVMEQLNAVNLEKVFLGKEQLPQSFDYDVFFEALEGYIEEMHTVCHVYHGDLKPRNIMVDKDTGLPYIIDFGRSGDISEKGEHDPGAKEDWNECDKVEEKMSTYLENLQNINIVL